MLRHTQKVSDYYHNKIYDDFIDINQSICIPMRLNGITNLEIHAVSGGASNTGVMKLACYLSANNIFPVTVYCEQNTIRFNNIYISVAANNDGYAILKISRIHNGTSYPLRFIVFANITSITANAYNSYMKPAYLEDNIDSSINYKIIRSNNAYTFNQDGTISISSGYLDYARTRTDLSVDVIAYTKGISWKNNVGQTISINTIDGKNITDYEYIAVLGTDVDLSLSNGTTNNLLSLKEYYGLSSHMIPVMNKITTSVYWTESGQSYANPFLFIIIDSLNNKFSILNNGSATYGKNIIDEKNDIVIYGIGLKKKFKFFNNILNHLLSYINSKVVNMLGITPSYYLF